MPFLFHLKDCVIINGKFICWDVEKRQAVVTKIEPDTNAEITEEELITLFDNIKKNRSEELKQVKTI